MKISKKLIVTALALSLGIGSVTPSIKSFADESTKKSYIDVDQYKKTAEEWLKAYKNAKKFSDEKESLEKTKSEKTTQLADKVIEIGNKEDQIKNLTLKYTKDQTEIEEEYKAYPFGSEKYKEKETKLANLKKEYEARYNYYFDIELKNLKVEQESIRQALVEAENKLKALYSYTDKDGKEQEDRLDNVITALKEIEKTKKEDFVKAGATEEEMKAIIKADKVIVPEKRSFKAEIKAMIEKIESKLEGINFIKTNMPNSFKKYEKQITAAENKAKEAIKKAKEFIGE